MKKIAVLMVGILCFASVDATGNTLEITDAQIAGENDAKGFKWKWFAAGYFIIHAIPIVLISTNWFIEEFTFDRFDLYDTFDTIDPRCCFAIYGLSPTAVALIHSPAPPADRLLGKSPDWVDAYTKAYKKNMRVYRAASSAVGCITGTATLASTLCLLIPLITGGTPGDAD